eukprot:4733264-Amphidinium_carterae.1
MQQALASTTTLSNSPHMQHTSKDACKCPAGCKGVPILLSRHGVTGFRASQKHAHRPQQKRNLGINR